VAKGSFDLPATSEWAFGQCGSQSLIAGMPADNPRWDCISFDAYTWKYPAGQSDLMFDEVRLYSGALSKSDLSALKPGL